MDDVARRVAPEGELLQGHDLGSGGDAIRAGETGALAAPPDPQDAQADLDLPEKIKEPLHLRGNDPHPLLLRVVLPADLPVIPQEKLDLALPGRAERMMLPDADLQ